MLDTFAEDFIGKAVVNVALNWYRKNLSQVMVHAAKKRALPAQLYNFLIEQVDMFGM